MITMYDTVTPGAIGRLASTASDAVAGYIDGRYADLAELERLYPNHHHVSIAVTSADDADCLDIETGDATPADGPGWVRRQHARGLARPWLYANLSTMPAVWAALRLAGIARNSVILWVADWTGRPEIPAGYDACQYTDHGPQGQNVDVSVCLDSCFKLPAPHHPHKRQRHHLPHHIPHPHPRPHRKVVAGGLAGALTTVVFALLHAGGVHISPQLDGAVVTIAGAVAAYLTPAKNA